MEQEKTESITLSLNFHLEDCLEIYI